MVVVYADGSCKPTNPGPAGAGFVVIEDGKVTNEVGIFLGDGTNNIAEISALKYALKFLKSKNMNDEEILIKTDSQYVIGIFSKAWKAKANIELIEETKIILSDFSNISFEWVKGHSKEKYNDLVDLAAKKAVDDKKDWFKKYDK